MPFSSCFQGSNIPIGTADVLESLLGGAYELSLYHNQHTVVPAVRCVDWCAAGDAVVCGASTTG